MIYILLDAFEDETKKDAVWKLFKRKKVLFIILIVLIISIIGFSIFSFFFRGNKSILILSVICCLLVYMLPIIDEKTKVKTWEETSKVYNEKLNELSNTIKRQEFKINNKLKMQRLIEKCQNEIDKLKMSIDEKKQGGDKIINTYILPVLAYFAGKEWGFDFSIDEVLYSIVIVFGCIFIFGFIFKQVFYFTNILIYKNMDRLEYLTRLLEDLYDRDCL